MNVGPGYRRIRIGPFEGRWRIRGAVTMSVLLLLLLFTLAAHVLVGTAVSPGAAVRALLGQGDPLSRVIVTQWRLPRASAAAVVGAALGAAGAIFQTVTRNPLGSPDILGLSTGAYTGALVTMLVVGRTSFGATAIGALVGGLLTGALIYLLASRTGQASLRLIIVGLGVAAMLSACNRWLILTSDSTSALQAASWGAGSLSGITAARVWPAALTILALLGVVMAAGPRLRLFALGDEFVTTLGGRGRRDRALLLGAGAVLTAVATALAGPIAFIALAAPQLARLATGGAQPAPAPAAAMGALLLVLSDFAAQHAFGSIKLPTGVVTVTMGGIYLVLLLHREGRRA